MAEKCWHDWLVAHAYIMYANTPWTIAEIARRLGVSRRKVHWALTEYRRGQYGEST